MSNRVKKELWETSSGNYVADIGLTLKEVKELMKVLQPAIVESHKSDKPLDNGRKTEILSGVMTYLQEVNQLLKYATNKRQQGRYLTREDSDAEQ